MAHFAELDANNVVTRVIVVNDAELLLRGQESESKGVEFLSALYGHSRWKQTSYTGSMRGCFAGIGFIYNPKTDNFSPPVTEPGNLAAST